MENSHYIINFTDITLNETQGFFDEVQKIMLKEFHGRNRWTIRSSVSIVGDMGVGGMEIQCHGDGLIYIVKYFPAESNVFYNPDIPVFSEWAQEHGWKVPQPLPSLVKEDKTFWKYFYDTLLIDSDYLDEIYGKRPQLRDESDPDYVDDEEEEEDFEYEEE